MSDIMSGRVTRVHENTFDDGNVSVSFRIAGDNRYFRTGRNRFAGIVEEGNTIKFKMQPVSEKAAKVIGTPKKGSGPTASAPAEAGGNKGYGSNDAAIRYQSSRKDALVMAGMILTAQALKLPAKESSRLEVLEALVDRYTAAFYADIETKGAVARTAPKAEEKPVSEDAAVDAEDEATDDEDEWE
jgi:hypothetical protein